MSFPSFQTHHTTQYLVDDDLPDITYLRRMDWEIIHKHVLKENPIQRMKNK